MGFTVGLTVGFTVGFTAGFTVGFTVGSVGFKRYLVSITVNDSVWDSLAGFWRARSSQRSFCRPLTADTSEHPTTRHIASYMYALKTSSTETLQPAL